MIIFPRGVIKLCGAGSFEEEEKGIFFLPLCSLSSEIVLGCFLEPVTFAAFSISGSFFPESKPSDTIFKIAFWLGYLNSCINPIIYPCSSQEFKKAFQNVLKGQCLPRRYSANKYSLSFNLNPPSNHIEEAPKDIVRIPVSSGENFYKISKSDGMCEWKLFSAVQNMSSKRTASNKDRSGCAAAKVKSKGFLRVCCCAGTSGSNTPKDRKVPTIKIHTVSVSDNGEDV